MFGSELPRFFDILRGQDLSRKVRLHDVLQSGNLHVIEETAARANVGIDEARVRRILPPVREFVAIGVEDRVKTKWLDRNLLFCRLHPLANSRSEGAEHRHGWSWLVQRESQVLKTLVALNLQHDGCSGFQGA